MTPSAEPSTKPVLRVPFSKVVCDGREWEYLREVLESGWLTTASKVQAFEARFAEAVGARHALAVNSCTSALHLGLEALGVERGDTVLLPTLTFTATAEVVRYFDAEPVLLDVDPTTGLLTTEIVEHALERYPHAKALIPVHFGGQPAPLVPPLGNILELCRAKDVRVLEDAAHAFPTRCGTKSVGAVGELTAFSFYANKTITTGEGGMLTTDDDRLAARIKVMRLHGIDRDVWSRYTSSQASWEYDVVAPGFKYNMPDINAAIGLAQLERAEPLRQSRQDLALAYLQKLESCRAIEPLRLIVPPEDHSWHLFIVRVRESSPIDRNELIGRLGQAGIGTSVHYKPLHRMTYYRERARLDPADYPGAEAYWRGCVSLPLYPSMTEDEQDRVVDVLRELLGTDG